MPADTNPHMLVAQYKKARKLANFLFDLGVTEIDIEPTDEVRETMGEAAGLASAPSRAVVTLASVMLAELCGAGEDARPNLVAL